MDKNKIMLSVLMNLLIKEYKYRPTQLQNAMGVKYEALLSWAEVISKEKSNDEFEKIVYELFLEYVELI